MDLIYSQYGEHEAGFNSDPIGLIRSSGYLVTGVKFHPACDNVIISVTREKFKPTKNLPDFIREA